MSRYIEDVPTGGPERIELASMAPASLIPTSPEDAHTFLIEYIQRLEIPEDFEEMVFAQPPKGDGMDGDNVLEPIHDILNDALGEFGNSFTRLGGFSKNEVYLVPRQPRTGSNTLEKILSTVVFTEERAAACPLVDRFAAITVDYARVMRTLADFARETWLVVNIAFKSTKQPSKGSTVYSQEKIVEELLKKYDESEGLINALVTLENALSELISCIPPAEAAARGTHTDAKTSNTLLSTERFRSSLRVMGILPVIVAAIGVGAVHTNNDQIVKFGSLVGSGILALLYGSIWRERLNAFRTADRDTTNVLKELTNQVRDGTFSLREGISSYTVLIRAKRELLKTELLGDHDLEHMRRWEEIAEEYEVLCKHAKSVEMLFRKFHIWEEFSSFIPFLGTVDVSRLEVQDDCN